MSESLDLKGEASKAGPEAGSKAGSKDWRDVARLGRNSGWRYLLGVFLFIFAVLGIGGIALSFLIIGILLSQGVPPESVAAAAPRFMAQPSVLAFVANNTVFLWGLAALAVILPVIHRRPFWSLLGHRQRLHPRRLLAALGFHFGMLSLVGAIVYFVSPEDFEWTFQPKLWLGLLLVTVPLTFLQVACEELFFRGYLLQGLGLLIRPRWLLAGLSAIPFALVHIRNPEVMRGWEAMMLYYFSYGVVMSWLTLKDNGLELALGLHLATNFFGILIISAVDSVLPAPSIFTVNADGNPLWTVLVFWLEAVLFYYVFLGRKRTSLKPH